jgi:segregation and condensation protein B
MSAPTLKQIVEGALFAAGGPLNLEQIQSLFPEEERPARVDLEEAVAALRADYAGRGIEIAQVAGGWRVQVNSEVAPWVARLWDEKPTRYSRALLETLALIAYRQPITRGEIEDIRGVAVTTQIIKTLSEREWVRVVGHRDVPGRPALYATTRRFLDYFGLRSLNDLPPLAEIRDPAFLGEELALDESTPPPVQSPGAGAAGGSTTPPAS